MLLDYEKVEIEKRIRLVVEESPETLISLAFRAFLNQRTNSAGKHHLQLIEMVKEQIEVNPAGMAQVLGPSFEFFNTYLLPIKKAS